MSFVNAEEQGRHPARAGLRESCGSVETIVAARERSMSERLELALSWNAVAAELRAGLVRVTRDPDRPSITKR